VLDTSSSIEPCACPSLHLLPPCCPAPPTPCLAAKDGSSRAARSFNDSIRRASDHQRRLHNAPVAFCKGAPDDFQFGLAIHLGLHGG